MGDVRRDGQGKTERRGGTKEMTSQKITHTKRKRRRNNCETDQTGIVSLNQTDSDRSVLEDKGSIPPVLCRCRMDEELLVNPDSQ